MPNNANSKKNKTIFLVYLAGSIAKAHTADEKTFWGEAEKIELTKKIAPHELVFLDPSERTDNLNDSLAVLGRDFLMVMISDAVLVDAREKRGVGVGAEIDRAETQNIPVISIIPPNTNYHKFDTMVLGQKITEFKHPFAYILSTHVAKNFSEAGHLVVNQVTPRHNFHLNPISEKILNAMQTYIRTQLNCDQPFLSLYKNNNEIKRRIDIINSMKPIKPYAERYL